MLQHKASYNRIALSCGFAAFLSHSATAQTHTATFSGDEVNDYFGSSVALAGDVNGDGVSDFMVGGYRGPGSMGTVKVYSGKDSSLIHAIYGNPGERLGFVHWVGDVNSDGYDDLIANGLTGVGRIFSGLDASVLFGSNFRFGGGVGDIDGDSYFDYHYEGSVFSGADESLLSQLDTSNGTYGLFVGDLNGDGNNDYVTSFGGILQARSSVDNTLLHEVVRPSPYEGMYDLGDVDADGLDDWGLVYSVLGSEDRVDVISGATGLTIHSLEGYDSHYQSQDALAGVGDADGDGFGDFVISGFPVRLHSGRTGGVLAQFIRDDGVQDAYTVVGIPDTNGDGRPEILLGNAGAVSAPIFAGTAALFSYDGPVGSNYCGTTINSSGAAAEIAASGSSSLSANNLLLAVHSTPSSRPGVFVMSTGQQQLPLGNGLLCVGAQGTSILRLPSNGTDGNGHMLLALDVTSNEQITSGSSWNFQAWFRDPDAGGSNYNLSDALTVTFVP